MIAFFFAIILLSILGELVFWTYMHGWLVDQLVVITGVIGFLGLTSALLVVIHLKLYGSNHRAHEILWGTAFVISVIAVMATLFTLAETLLR